MEDRDVTTLRKKATDMLLSLLLMLLLLLSTLAESSSPEDYIFHLYASRGRKSRENTTAMEMNTVGP